jgi:hypothetical protein
MRGQGELSIKDFMVYVPAKDFEQSKRFYTALGFAMSPGWGGSARDVVASGAFDAVRIKPPEMVDGSRVLHVHDPSGVLLVFVQ